MDLHYKQEVTVGLLVIAAIILFFAGLVWLSGAGLPGTSRIAVEVRFNDVAGLNVGDPVWVSGMQVGRVTNIRLVNVGEVTVAMEIESSDWSPRIDARAQVTRPGNDSGIAPGVGRPGTPRRLSGYGIMSVPVGATNWSSGSTS